MMRCSWQQHNYNGYTEIQRPYDLIMKSSHSDTSVKFWAHTQYFNASALYTIYGSTTSKLALLV